MKKAEQSEATRRALLQAARELFTEHGYADTATEDIAQRAGVTRGALYYQFHDKLGLFRAVFEDLNLQIAQKVMSAIQAGREEGGDLWGQIVRTGTKAYLEACLDPAVQRIGLVEAPAVLGWEKYRESDEKYGIGLICGVIQELIDTRLIAPQPVEPLAHLDTAAARKEMEISLRHIFDSIHARSAESALVDEDGGA